MARLKEDDTFRREVLAADEEARGRLIAEAGFECTREENAAERERLSDQALSEVTCGSTCGRGDTPPAASLGTRAPWEAPAAVRASHRREPLSAHADPTADVVTASRSPAAPAHVSILRRPALENHAISREKSGGEGQS